MFFHALTFAGFRGRCLNMRLIGRMLKHLPRDPESVNAMKQTCVIVHLVYFTLFQPKGEFQICPRMDLNNILYVEYLRYNNYKNEIILFLERC